MKKAIGASIFWHMNYSEEVNLVKGCMTIIKETKYRKQNCNKVQSYNLPPEFAKTQYGTDEEEYEKRPSIMKEFSYLGKLNLDLAAISHAESTQLKIKPVPMTARSNLESQYFRNNRSRLTRSKNENRNSEALTSRPHSHITNNEKYTQY